MQVMESSQKIHYYLKCLNPNVRLLVGRSVGRSVSRLVRFSVIISHRERQTSIIVPSSVCTMFRPPTASSPPCRRPTPASRSPGRHQTQVALLLEVKLPYDPVCLSVGLSVGLS